MTDESVVAVGRVARGIRVGGWRADLLVVEPGPGEMLSGAARRAGESLVAGKIGAVPTRVWIGSLLPSGRPVALDDTGPLTLSVSLSHERGLVGAAVSDDARVGIDIVDPETVGAGLDHWFEPEGRRCIPAAPLWAAKEAAYKAAGIDVTFHPGSVSITGAGPDAFRWAVRSPARTVVGEGAWIVAGRHLVALAGCVTPPAEVTPCS